MKTFNFKTTGVLWRLATFYGPMYVEVVLDNGTDICSYTQAVLKGLFKVLLIIFGCGLAAALLGDFSGWVAAMIVQGALIEPDEPAQIIIGLLAVSAVISIFVLLFFGAKAAYEYARNLRYDGQPGPPSQAQVMYEAWKKKYCFKIEFKAKD